MRSTSTKTFDDILEKIRKESANTRDLGDRFEKITEAFLKTDKLYANRFHKVWLWKSWPKKRWSRYWNRLSCRTDRW